MTETSDAQAGERAHVVRRRKQERAPVRVHRLPVRITLICWPLFTLIYLVSHGGGLIENDLRLFIAVVLAPVLPLVLLPGALLGGDIVPALVLLFMQAVEVVPWLARARWPESSVARGSVFFGLGIYWCIMLLHL